MKLYKFHWDCGRAGDLDGIFVVNDVGQAALNAIIDTEVYFGEVLGKHSEIAGRLEREEVTEIIATPEEVATVARVLAGEIPPRGWVTLTGFNPLDYAETEAHS